MSDENLIELGREFEDYSQAHTTYHDIGIESPMAERAEYIRLNIWQQSLLHVISDEKATTLEGLLVKINVVLFLNKNYDLTWKDRLAECTYSDALVWSIVRDICEGFSVINNIRSNHPSL